MRGSIAGGTDYSHQSIADISTDLDDLAKNFCKWSRELSGHVKKLKENKRWAEVPDDFKIHAARAMKLIDTACDELGEIGKEIRREVQAHHSVRLRQLAKSADEINREIGKMWHADYLERWKSGHYGEDWFMIVEDIYADGRDSVATLLDLDAIGVRLDHFTGRRTKPPVWRRVLGFFQEHVLGSIIGILSALIVAYLVYRFGWG